MTSVPPTQPPAAPETDVRLTFEEREAIGWGVDYGTVIAEVERIVAERVRVVEGERDAARSEHNESCATTDQFRDQKARAESAEAAHEALRKGIGALSDEWERHSRLFVAEVDKGTREDWEHVARTLRALVGAR